MAVLVLGIVLAAVTPELTASHPERLDLAAAEVAAAVRFARSEALRTGDVHAVEVDEASSRIIVERMDMSSKPASVDAVLYHPIRKQPYDFTLGDDATTRGVRVDPAGPAFQFVGGAQRQRLMFDATGVPLHIDTTAGTQQLLAQGEIDLQFGALGARVTVQPYTGRVVFP